ncbi:MAG: hypothetical protein RID07_06490, partial [Lacipirellulaceae bacterium]
MKKTHFCQSFLALCMMIAVASSAQAQEGGDAGKVGPGEQGSGWYYEPVERAGLQPTIAQQRSMARANQRAARIAASKAWGFTPSRPTASGIPFTSLYSHSWQMPGGR